ncbi:hypothetical protein MINTM002_29580 [Mycobacterium intracellulare]|nr:hypothetical protein MINTM002_29580 [Mycobacterium intracellulare]
MPSINIDALNKAGRPGASVQGIEILTGVLEATVRDPSRSGPGTRLINRLTKPKLTSASAGNPTPIFTPARRHPKGNRGLIRKLTLDPTRDYQPRGVKPGNSPTNKPQM